MTNINSVKNELKSMLGLKFGNYNSSVKALQKEQEHKIFANGSIVVFGSTNLFENVTKAYNIKGAFSIKDSNTDRTYACCDDLEENHSHNNKNFTTIIMSRGKYSIVIKDNLSDKANKGIIDENDKIIIYGINEEPKETTLKEFLG